MSFWKRCTWRLLAHMLRINALVAGFIICCWMLLNYVPTSPSWLDQPNCSKASQYIQIVNSAWCWRPWAIWISRNYKFFNHSVVDHTLYYCLPPHDASLDNFQISSSPFEQNLDISILFILNLKGVGIHLTLRFPSSNIKKCYYGKWFQCMCWISWVAFFGKVSLDHYHSSENTQQLWWTEFHCIWWINWWHTQMKSYITIIMDRLIMICR